MGYGVKQVSTAAATDVQEKLAAAAATDPVDAEELPFAAEYFGVEKGSGVAVLGEGTGCHLAFPGEEVGETTPIREAPNSNFDLECFNEISDDTVNMWVQSVMNHSPQT